MPTKNNCNITREGRDSEEVSRGLGPSGAASVAGVMLANAVDRLELSKDRMLDFILMVERHPDNVAALLMGEFVGTYLSDLDPQSMKRIEVPLSKILGESACGINTGLQPPIPSLSIGHSVKLGWSPAINIVVILPDYEVKTTRAREFLPSKYEPKDVVFNMQRVAVLPHALGQTYPDPSMTYHAMQDRVHQPRQSQFEAGLEYAINLTPASMPSLLGICLSGAGPSILALATHNHEDIAKRVVSIPKEESSAETQFEWKNLKPAEGGATIEFAGAFSWLRTATISITRSIRSKI
ncbi:MAG: hypothetical protein Q9164_004017 [Protoblastenia rupestris]